MVIKEITGAELTDERVDVFNGIVRESFEKSSLDVRDHFTTDNVFFYLEYESKTVAFGRFVKVDGITIGGEPWNKPVYGRSLISVLPQYRGKRFGQAIVMHMRNYEETRVYSQIGIHGKMSSVNSSSTSLTDFYRNCGLEVDEEISKRFYALNDGTLKSLSHVNISYKEDDELIAAVLATSGKVILPFGW